MEKEITLKDGREVLVRDLQANEDVFDLARFINEFLEEKAYLSINKVVTPEEETEWLQGKMKDMEKDMMIDWRVFLDGKVVGGIDAWKAGKLKESGNVEMGIALSKEVRGQGLGSQLIKLMIEEIKTRWKPKNIVIAYYAANEGAGKLYRSLGFKEFARFPNWVNHFGEYNDKIYLVLE